MIGLYYSVLLLFKMFFGIPEKYVLISRTTGDQVIFDVVNYKMETAFGSFQFHPDDADAIEESYELMERF